MTPNPIQTKDSIPCNLCGSTKVHPIKDKDRNGHPLRSVICTECGLVWTAPQPSNEEERNFYTKEYRLNYKGSFQPKPKHRYRAGKVAIQRFKKLKPFLPKPSEILDIGAGSGELVYVLRKMGHSATGIEPNEDYAYYASNALNLPVQQGFYQNANIADSSQNMVTLFHVVEHLENPLDSMKHCHRWLKPNGLIVVEVPNIEAVCQAPNTQFHRGHLFHFNPYTLEAMVRKAGFSPLNTYTSPDGGNIAVIARKSEKATNGSLQNQNNYRKVQTILRQHTPLRHLLSPPPYIRPFKKLFNRLDEWKHAKSTADGNALLDNLIDRSL